VTLGRDGRTTPAVPVAGVEEALGTHDQDEVTTTNPRGAVKKPPQERLETKDAGEWRAGKQRTDGDPDDRTDEQQARAAADDGDAGCGSRT
jgi:hypothetical protein